MSQVPYFREGTIAADTNLFRFGPRIKIPGYSDGVVEDRGGAIQGGKIGLSFKTLQQPRERGRRNVSSRCVAPERIRGAPVPGLNPGFREPPSRAHR
jgi:hypothetical protein